MNSERFCKALDGISDDLIDAAADVYDKKKKQKRSVFPYVRVACAALVLTALLFGLFGLPGGDPEIITAPGILKVYAYDTTTGIYVEDMVRCELKEGVVSHPYRWTTGMNWLYGLPLTLIMEDDRLEGMDITFDVSVDMGEFYADNRNDKYKKDPSDAVAKTVDIYLGKEFTIDNGETIYWAGYELLETPDTSGESFAEILKNNNNEIKTHIIIKADGNIVGYAIVLIRYNDDGWYSASVLETVFYPPIDGEFQSVTEEYVNDKMKTADKGTRG